MSKSRQKKKRGAPVMFEGGLRRLNVEVPEEDYNDIEQFCLVRKPRIHISDFVRRALMYALKNPKEVFRE